MAHTFRFSAQFSCTKCEDITVCSGQTDSYYDQDEEGGYEVANEYTPRYFDPPPKMFGTPDGLLEKELSAILVSAMHLYWSDPGAAATKLGIFLEEFLTGADVPKREWFKDKQGKPYFRERSLHNRIEWFKKNKGHTEASDYFLACKWIRNAGGHTSSGSSREDVLDSMVLIEAGLGLLDGKETPAMVAKRINKHKGSRHKKRATKKKKPKVHLGKPKK